MLISLRLQDMAERTEAHQMELMWRGSPAFGRESDLLVSLSATGTYTPPDDTWVATDESTQALVPLLVKVSSVRLVTRVRCQTVWVLLPALCRPHTVHQSGWVQTILPSLRSFEHICCAPLEMFRISSTVNTAQHHPSSVQLLDDGSKWATMTEWTADRPPATVSVQEGRQRVETLLERFYKQVELLRKAAPVGQNDVMLYFGTDFAFKDATLWFEFADKLMHYVNRDGALNVMYSTPERFLAVKKASLASGSEDSGSPDGGESSGSSARASDSGAGSSDTVDSNHGGAAREQKNSSNRGSSSANSSWALKSDDYCPYRCEKSLFWTGTREAGTCIRFEP
jgi:hypothetical protein